MPESVVVLIGGAPGAGKTTLGRALGKKLDIASLTADDIAAGLKGVTTPESHPGLHIMGRAVTGLSSVEYFTQTPAEKLIEDATEQHLAVWPGLRAVVRTRSLFGPSVVIDGWFMRPEQVASLEMDNVKPFWLNVDREVLAEREDGTPTHKSSSDPDRMLQNFLGRSYWYNDLIEEQARRFNMPVLHQDGTKSVDELCDTVIAQL